MSNLYEILEVSEKASKEVIDKAYKVLVKKYHPDLQEEKDKQTADLKIKKINEAYEILSDEEKRKQYDLELKANREQEKIEEDLKNKQYKQYIANVNKQDDKQKNTNRNNKEDYNNIEKIQNEISDSYMKAYYNYLRKLGYKIKQPWTVKRFLNLLEGIGIFLAIILIIWFFPPTNKLLVDTYQNNNIIKSIVDIIVNIFRGIGNGIANFFKNIFNI